MKVEPASRFVWEKALRQARIGAGKNGASTLALAFAVATFANADGTRIHPGVALLADGLGLSARTVDRALSRLRREGYLTKVRQGNSRAGLADEYRLSLPVHTTAMSGEGPAADSDYPTGSAEHPTAGTDQPTAVTGSADSDVVPPDQLPTQLHQTITTRPGTTATATKPEPGPWTRAAQGTANRSGGDSVAPPPGFTRPSLVGTATP